MYVNYLPWYASKNPNYKFTIVSLAFSYTLAFLVGSKLGEFGLRKS